MPFGTIFAKRAVAVLSLVLAGLSGCAAFHPMNGVPARFLPADMKVARRNGQRIIDLSLLNQQWDGVHRVDAGDVLGIYIGGVLGKIDENPQVQIPQQNSDFLPAAGIPVTVREDGTISLPMIGAISVRGMTTRETEDLIRKTYTNHSNGKEYLPPGRERILVSLIRPRQTRVLVVRQDSRMEPTSNAMVGMVNLGTSKRGSGKAVSLPAYKNDVLNALIATDGLPGLDAENAVYVIRRNPNLPGGDQILPPPFDPEQLIRENRLNRRPVIRGQSGDGRDYRRPTGPSQFGANGNQFGDYRSSGAGSNQPVPSPYSQNPYSQNPSATFTQGNYNQAGASDQNGFTSRQDSGLNPYAAPANSGYTSGGGMDSAKYQAPPYTQTPSSAYSSTNGRYGTPIQSTPASWSPTPLTTFGQNNSNLSPPADIPVLPQGQPANPYTTAQPFNQSTPAQQLNPYATPQPNYNQPSFNPYQPPYQSSGSSLAPGQNNAVPEPITPGLQQPIYGAPMNQFGGYGDPQPIEVMNPEMGGVSMPDGRRIIRIPIRLAPGEHIDIKNEDVILNEGDIVFIESRDAEVFFTGGLLGGGQYTLPRDFDLDILQAISIASSRNQASSVRAMGGVSALNSDVTVSPSNVIVLRKLPEGGEIPIKINLYEARSDLAERIFIQPGDYIYLQYTPLEAVAAFIDRHLIEGALFGLIAQQATTGRNGN